MNELAKRVAIVGGGLAGIACALRLVEAGYEVTLIETRKRLGGRATSLVDPRSGITVDNCQHVVLGCCTNLLDLYERLGVLDQIHWHEELFWTAAKKMAQRPGRSAKTSLGPGEFDVMRAGWLPAPMHLAGSMRKMRLFDRSEKRAIARAMWRMIRMGSMARIAWANRTFSEFLSEMNQPAELVEDFWNTIIVSACNLNVDRVGAAYALQVFQEGFLANKFSYAMGVSQVPLGDLYDPALAKILAAGGRVELGLSAKAIAFDGRRVTGVVTEEDMVEANAVVSAVPWDRLDKLTSQTMKDADRRLQHLSEINVSPILGVHLWFECEVMKLPHLVLAGGDVQWLFNKGLDDAGRQHIHAVISGADAWMDMNEDQIVAKVLEDVEFALPDARGRKLVEKRTIKEKRATFAALPGVEQFRPAASALAMGVGSGGIPNLFLAGDWCDTGWPATMEGAVRSGYAAAAAISGQGSVVADIPTGKLALLAGLR
ncbi:MAG TPA: hydroxysqualene dehydroxylase HpnE [Phycisphaerales bacterium]|nr:hydroxysqualene dehydroxylase HpnE [Phycisphaerales bacterium]